jgi:hypothetical protein
VSTSGKGENIRIGRLALSAAVWLAFIIAAHEIAHVVLPVTGPVPGAGLKTLLAQSAAISLGAVVLIVARQPGHRVTLRAVLATLIWVGLIVLGHYLSHLDAGSIRQTLAELREAMGMGALLTSALMLALLLGLPFVPSVEMGLMMMLVFGRYGAVAAWLATIAGISLAYAAGRYMPADRMHHWLRSHGINPDSENAGREPAISALVDKAWAGRGRAGRIAAFLASHRYLLFALLINMPGNSVVGGGGGIALICGFTRLYRWPWFILTVALASLPIPLLVFFGLIRVDRWLAALGGP